MSKLLLELLNEWIDNPQWWFANDPQVDRLILARYEYLLHVDFGECDVSNPLVKTGMIVLYDQVARHTRNVDTVNKYAPRAIQFAKSLMTTGEIEYIVGDALCFALLPLRHTKDPHNIRAALTVIWERLDQPSEGKFKDTYRRFLKAAYQRWDPVEPGSWVETFHVQDISQFVDVLDYCSRNPVSLQLLDRDDILMRSFKAWTCEHVGQGKRIMVSLSGGVDSMVCSYIATALYGPDACIFVHINYMNRDSSLAEEDFVKCWSVKLGVPCLVRRIDEIHRPTCMLHDLRDTYESYTRRVRFACYKQVSDSIVVLGHNKDDAFENIMTNIAHQHHWELLPGMIHETQQDGVHLVRPFLCVSKAAIIEFAHRHGISFLHDSTPKWSQRGKIRDIVVPAVHQWDPMFAKGMFAMATEMQDVYAAVEDMVGSHRGDVFDRVPQSLVAWKVFFKSRGITQPSQKALATLVESIKKGTMVRTFEMSKHLRLHISKTNDGKYHMKTSISRNI